MLLITITLHYYYYHALIFVILKENMLLNTYKKKLLIIQILVYVTLLIVYKENIKIPAYIMLYFVTFFKKKYTFTKLHSITYY